MQIPLEFKLFVALLDDSIFPTPFDERRWIDNQIQSQDDKTCRVIGQFLRSVLGKSLSGPELREIWDAGGPMFTFESDEQLRSFLTLVREQIDNKVAPE